MPYSQYLRDNHLYSYGSHDLDTDDDVCEDSSVSGLYNQVNDTAQELDIEGSSQVTPDANDSVGTTRYDFNAFKEADHLTHRQYKVNRGSGRDLIDLDDYLASLEEEEDDE